MYYHRQVFAKGCKLEVTEQQRDHVAEARQEIIRQELNKKQRRNVRIVRN